MLCSRAPWDDTAIDGGLEERLRVPDPRQRLAPEGLERLKRTRSLCPTCLEVLDADVGLEDGRVVMWKRCPAHGAVRGLIESDPGFYRKVMNQAPVERMRPRVLVLPATHRCNLNCTLCFVPKRDRDNLSLASIERIVEEFPGETILISGGEPTLREDLPEIIRAVRKAGKHAQIASNAIKLAERDFVEQLLEAGLQHVLLSFNSLKEEPYLTINQRPLLEAKTRALENCVAAGLDVVLSPTIFRELNEDEIGPMIQLCLNHAPRVSQLRIRGACRVGRHGTFSPPSTADLLGEVARSLGATSAEWVAELDTACTWHSILQFNMIGAFRQNPAGHWELMAWSSGTYKKEGTPEATLEELYEKARARNRGFLPRAIFEQRYKFLEINSWGWPDASNIDFSELWSHGVYHLYDNRVPMNFCEAVLRAENL